MIPYWKQQVIQMLRINTFESTLLKEFSRHSPNKDCSIILDAFKNYFSSSNPGFEHNWFTFDNGVTFTISKEGMLFALPSDATEDIKDDAEYSQWIISEKITKPLWLRVFMGKFPDIQDD
jgi:hypothetical protein